MKRFMAIAIAVAMILTIMPTAFATTKSVMDPREAAKSVKGFETSASVTGEEIAYGRSHAGQTTINPASIDKKYQTLDKTKGWMDEIEPEGIGIIESDLAASRGYWFTEEKESFKLVSENPAFDGDAYGMCLVPATESGAYRYAKNELMFFNFDLYQSFDDTTGELKSLIDREDGYGVSAWVYAGLADDESYPLVGAWSSTQAGLSINLKAPDDDYIYMIYLFIEKVDEFKDGFGAWYTLSTADGIIRDANVGEDMTVGTEIKASISSSDKLIAATLMESYVPEYGQLHKITLEGNKQYALSFTSDDEIYTHLMFLTSGMDVINEMVGHDDDDHRAMKVFTTEPGTYYVAAFGLTMEDEGMVNLVVNEWEDYVGSAYPEVDEIIDLGSFGTEPHSGTIDGVDGVIWDYAYSTQNNYGILVVGGLAGNYTIQGDAQDVIVIAYDGARVILDNAAVEAVLLDNTVAPISVVAKGSAKISNPGGYAMLNEEGCLSGVYFTGDELTVEGVFGIVLEGAPVTLAAKTMKVDTTSMEGYYNIAMWVMGVNLPSVMLGKNAKFDGNNKVSKMSYDPDGNFTYGYAISEQDELYRPNQEGFGWDQCVAYFEITTDGISDGTVAAGLVGDANNDGQVNTGDATAVLKHAAGMIVLEGQGLANADANKDGQVNTGDATMILRHAAGMIDLNP